MISCGENSSVRTHSRLSAVSNECRRSGLIASLTIVVTDAVAQRVSVSHDAELNFFIYSNSNIPAQFHRALSLRFRAVRTLHGMCVYACRADSVKVCGGRDHGSRLMMACCLDLCDGRKQFTRKVHLTWRAREHVARGLVIGVSFEVTRCTLIFTRRHPYCIPLSDSEKVFSSSAASSKV